MTTVCDTGSYTIVIDADDSGSGQLTVARGTTPTPVWSLAMNGEIAVSSKVEGTSGFAFNLRDYNFAIMEVRDDNDDIVAFVSNDGKWVCTTESAGIVLPVETSYPPSDTPAHGTTRLYKSGGSYAVIAYLEDVGSSPSTSSWYKVSLT